VQFALLRRSDPGAGLVFTFDTETCDEVLLGRDPRCHVSLDPGMDSVAAIFHARIVPDPRYPSGLVVIDMNSPNGTFVDGVLVRGQAVLSTNSTLLLGRANGQTGPEFLVNIGEAPWHPPPPNQARRPEGAPPPPPDPFRYEAAPPPPPPEPFRYDAAAPPLPGPAPEPFRAASAPQPASGKWWDDKLPGVPSMQQAPNGVSVPGLPRNVNVRESGIRPMTLAVAGISILALVGALLWMRESRSPSVWTAPEIEQAYGNSILATDLRWKLVDNATGRAVYQWRPLLPFKPGDPRRAIFQGKDRAAVFVRMPDDSVEPVLILASPNSTSEANEPPTGGKTSGSAVAVNSGGFILTDRRNATPWTLPYEWPAGSFPGILIDPKTKQVDVIGELSQTWMPLHARAVVSGEPTFENLTAGGLSPVPVTLGGRADVYRARLRNSTAGFPISPAATSEDSELAVAKLQPNRPLTEVRVPEADPPLLLGQHVFVLGYTGAEANSQLRATEFQVLKAETASLGGSDEFALLTGTLSGTNQTGSAVFDSKGHLAGLLRVVLRNKEYLGEIVPIREGRELVRPEGAK